LQSFEYWLCHVLPKPLDQFGKWKSSDYIQALPKIDDVEVSCESSHANRRLIGAFTLVDALVAATMVVGIAGLSIPTFIATVVVHRSIERTTLARETARSVIENIRDFGVVNLIDGTYTLTKFGAVDSLTVLPNASGTVVITTPVVAVRKVVIRVQWTAGMRQGQQRTFSTVTLLTPGGVSP
jgi:hypothetical protein